MSVDAKQMKSLALAYMGDAVYEVYIREYLLEKGNVKPHLLHKKAITYVSAKAQSAVIRAWLDQSVLSQEELEIVARGRNAKSGSVPKNTSVQTYRYGTAFETLLGFLYLSGQKDRLQQLMQDAVRLVEADE